MKQDETWMMKYEAIKAFILTNKRNPSRYDPEERGVYCNWIKHQRKLYNTGELKPERVERLRELMELMEQYRHKNQYQ